MKKTAGTIILLLVLICTAVPVFAVAVLTSAEITLSYDIAGLSVADAAGSVTFDSAKLTLEDIIITDYAGDYCTEKLVPGRTYYIGYTFRAAPGYSMPDSIDDMNLTIHCGEGTTLNYSRIAVYYGGGHETRNLLDIHTTVTVKGNVFQRIIGLFTDLILKIRAWSLF